jgi:hypothetical protein
MNTCYGLVDTPEAPEVGVGVSPSRKPTSASGSKEGTTTEPTPVSGK